MRLKQTGNAGGDCTAPYSVLLDKEYTVKEFITEILKSRSDEWGYIVIEKKGEIFGKPNCEYRYGKLISNLPKEILDKCVISARAHGGWTCMDYLLTVNTEGENENNK